MEVREVRGLSTSSASTGSLRLPSRGGEAGVFAAVAFGHTCHRTRRHPEGSRSTWGEVLVFPEVAPHSRLQLLGLGEGGGGTGHTALLGYARSDLMEADAAFGEAWVALRSVPALEGDMKRTVQQGPYQGEVLLRWRFDSRANRQQRAADRLRSFRTLGLTVVEGQDLGYRPSGSSPFPLSRSGLGSSPSPFGVLSTGTGDQTGAADLRTAVAKSTRHPIWDSDFAVPLGPGLRPTLSVQGPTDMGTADLGLLMDVQTDGVPWGSL